MKITILLFIVMFACPTLFGQNANELSIENARIKLEQLQRELWNIDISQGKEIEKLREQSSEKGEFETTKQFELRTQKLEEKINEIEIQILKKQGPSREDVYRQMNNIFRNEFTSDTCCRLGLYDADNQRFTLLSKDGATLALPVPISEAQQLKENFSEAKTIGIVGLLLNSQNKAQEYILKATILFRGKTYQTDSDLLTGAKAMQMLFGNYDFAKKTSVWKTRNSNPENDEDGDGEPDGEYSTLTSVVFRFISLKENDIDKYLLVANRGSLDEDGKLELTCHVCYGLPSIAVFAKKHGFWKIELSQKHAGEIGYYGFPGEPSLVKVGSDKFVLRFTWDDEHMGYISGGTYFWRIDKDFLKEIFNIYTIRDNSESDESEKEIRRSTITFVPSSLEFFDIKVLTTGKKTVKAGRRFTWKPFTEIKYYSFQDGDYRLVRQR